jgi:hypothetical protein
MIEMSLIKDETHYEKKQLDVMEEIFTQNFITSESAEPETHLNPATPEIRIHIRLTQGVLPELLFRALGEDLYDLIGNKDFLNAFIHPRSQETPSLVFSFVGDFRSFDFKITSKDEKNLAEGSQKMIEKLLSELNREELPPQSKDAYSFHYEKGDWIEA